MSIITNDSRIGGGGHGTAGGIALQASVSAQLALGLLNERPIDARLELGDAKPITVRCETEASVDDILVQTSQNGFIYVQAKTSFDLSPQLTSSLGSAVLQAVRLWIACAQGNGSRQWDRPLSSATDRIVFATSPSASDRVIETLSMALQRHRDLTAGKSTRAEAESV